LPTEFVYATTIIVTVFVQIISDFLKP